MGRQAWMVLEHQELGYQLLFKNGWCQRQVPRWTKKMGYSSSPSSSTPKSGRWLIISQTVLLGQIFLQLMLMGHFGLEAILRSNWPSNIDLDFSAIYSWNTIVKEKSVNRWMTSKELYKNNFALPKAATYDQEFTFFLGEKNSLKRFQSFDSSILYL